MTLVEYEGFVCTVPPYTLCLQGCASQTYLPVIGITQRTCENPGFLRLAPTAVDPSQLVWSWHFQSSQVMLVCLAYHPEQLLSWIQVWTETNRYWFPPFREDQGKVLEARLPRSYTVGNHSLTGGSGRLGDGMLEQVEELCCLPVFPP